MQITKLLLFILFASSAFPTQARECLARTWTGAVGSAPVMIEFDTIGADNTLAGRYYYRNNMDDLLLIRDPANFSRWKEIGPKGQVTGYVTISCSGESLTGEWRSPDGLRTQQLNARPDPSHAYAKNRLDAIKPMVVARKSLSTFRYEQLEAKGQQSITGLRLVGDGSGIAKINEKLKREFLSAIDEDITCRSYGRLSRGENHGFENEAEWGVVAWNKAFVVVSASASGYCGGAHPNFGSGASTYDVTTGDSEDVSSWLVEDYRKDISSASRLGKLLIQLFLQEGNEPQCRDEIQLSGQVVWPTPKGMVFQTWAPYASSACISDIVVPHSKITSYLSPRGKSKIQNFLNAAR